MAGSRLPASLAFRLGRLLLPAAIGLAGAWLGLLVGGSVETEAGPFTVRLSSNLGRGETEIELPPFGRLSADTHLAPLHLRATLTSVDALELVEFVRTRTPDQAVREVEDALLPALAPLGLRVLLVALGGAFVLTALTFRANRRAIGISLLATAVVVGGGQLLAWQTYRPARLLSPTFSGTLALAPTVVGPADTALDRIDEFRGELRRIVEGASRVFADVQSSPFLEEDEIRVLHISDIHLSPLGLSFARRVADAFDVDMVIDTGDLTSFGTPAENLIADSVPSFGRPYVFVRGNHDSTGVERAVAGEPNAVVLDGQADEVAGLSIYGVGDVFFTPDEENVPTDEEAEALLASANEQIASELEDLIEVPDLVAVHNDREALSVAGRVPLVISGHTHVPSARVVEGTLFLRVGSTGGSGFGVFAEEGGVPLSAELLYFDRNEGRLIGYDVIEQSAETGDVTLRRHIVSEEFGELLPSPTPTVLP